MNKQDRWSGIMVSIKILLCILFFAAMLITGLQFVNSSFNNLIGNDETKSIFACKKNNNSVYDISIFRTKQRMDMPSIALKFQKHADTAISWGTNLKDDLLRLIDTIKEYINKAGAIDKL